MSKIDVDAPAVDFGALANSVANLIHRAERHPEEAMKLSQAALNAAHALNLLVQLQDMKKD